MGELRALRETGNDSWNSAWRPRTGGSRSRSLQQSGHCPRTPRRIPGKEGPERLRRIVVASALEQIERVLVVCCSLTGSITVNDARGSSSSRTQHRQRRSPLRSLRRRPLVGPKGGRRLQRGSLLNRGIDAGSSSAEPACARASGSAPAMTSLHRRAPLESASTTRPARRSGGARPD